MNYTTIAILLITLIALNTIDISYSEISNNSTSAHIKNHNCGILFFFESMHYKNQCS